MKRRPWPIVILALSQIIVEPFSNLFLNSWFSHVSPRLYLRYFIESHQWLPLFYLFLLPPLMGAAAYAMKKWSYVVFVAGAAWMLFYNFQLVRDGLAPLSYALTIFLGNVGFVTYFLLPKVHAPYLNPKMRWWEAKTRFTVDWPCRIVASFDASGDQSGVSCRVLDFSVGGVFLLTSDAITMDQTVEVRMSPTKLSSDEIIAVKAKPVFSRPVDGGKGYGLQFSDLDKATSRRLAAIAKELKKSGTPLRNPPDDSWVAFKTWAKRALTTGKGLVPEVDQPMPKPAVPATSSESAKAS